ncbi:MAG TPA: glycosyltransferase family 39 protein [Chitinophagaceae bacterium]|nr:glycosyltransferase family 39 protein [Chitinophagaceae bacterium]
MMKISKIYFLNGAIILIAILISFIFYVDHGKKSSTFYGDALGYYSYLPSAFIYHNFKSIEILPTDKNIQQSIFDYANDYVKGSKRSPKGYYINQYTYGIALTELPFFAIAHAYEKFQGLPANGYSNTYQYLIKISSLFYAILGLLFLYKSLRTIFSSTISIISLAIIYIGTNLFWFTIYQSGMSHIPLFFLYSLLIYLSIKIHTQPRNLYFLLIGIVCGFITVVRPSDIICVLIPLLYNVFDKTSFQNKIKWIETNYRGLILTIVSFIIPILPQLIFWKIYTGHFIYNSYLDQSFNWLSPKIIEGLFGYSNGWLAYSPVMIFALVGILFYKKIKPFTLSIIIILPLYIYIIYSWWCYSYINGLGSRPMIHLYPLLALPLASFLFYLSQRNILFKTISALAILILVSVNLSFSYQVARGDLWSENTNFQFAFNTLFKTKLDYKDLVVADIGISQPDTHRMQTLKLLGLFDSTNSVDAREKYYIIHEGEEFSTAGIEVNYTKEIDQLGTHIKCSGNFYMPEGPPDMYRNSLMVFEIKHNDESSLWQGVKINNKIGKLFSTPDRPIHFGNMIINEWGEVYFYIPIPQKIQLGDKIKLSIWNIGKREMKLKNFKMEICKAN